MRRSFLDCGDPHLAALGLGVQCVWSSLKRERILHSRVASVVKENHHVFGDDMYHQF